MVYRDEVGSGWKSALDHYLSQRRADGWQDMATAEHSRTNGHEICDSVLAIADELFEVLGLVFSADAGGGGGRGAHFLEVARDESLRGNKVNYPVIYAPVWRTLTAASE